MLWTKTESKRTAPMPDPMRLALLLLTLLLASCGGPTARFETQEVAVDATSAAELISRYRASRGLPPVSADSGQLVQVFLHILTNAVDAVAGVPSPRITVATRSENGHVEWICADNGPGISEPERVFDPFYTTKPVGKGTGLGLSASYGIIKEHGGSITCHNREGGGAEFVVSLPVAQSAMPAAAGAGL
jgi:C4-dicarboxylate-specific signal transduction histidine kinase